MSRAAISVERVEFNPDKTLLGRLRDKTALLPVWPQPTPLWNLWRFLQDIRPPPMSRWYIIMASTKLQGERENTEEELEVEEVRATGKVSSTWARLIRKIFEVDALRCKKCGGEMKVIAFITRHSETRKFLKHIKEETARPPPLVPSFFQAPTQDSWSAHYMPPLEEYMRNPEYTI